MVPFRVVFLVFFSLSCVGACNDEESPPNAGNWLRDQERSTLQRQEGRDVSLSDPSDLSELLPRFDRKDSYTWGRQTLLIPGYVSGVVVDRKTSKKLVTIILFDRVREPESLLSLRSLKETRYGVPFERVRGDLIRLFVLDRFEVTLQIRNTAMVSTEMLEHIASRIRIRSFSKHWAKVQEAAKEREGQD